VTSNSSGTFTRRRKWNHKAASIFILYVFFLLVILGVEASLIGLVLGILIPTN